MKLKIILKVNEQKKELFNKNIEEEKIESIQDFLNDIKRLKNNNEFYWYEI